MVIIIYVTTIKKNFLVEEIRLIALKNRNLDSFKKWKFCNFATHILVAIFNCLIQRKKLHLLFGAFYNDVTFLAVRD